MYYVDLLSIGTGTDSEHLTSSSKIPRSESGNVRNAAKTKEDPNYLRLSICVA